MRPVISKKHALELQKIIKDTTGRNLPLGDCFALLGHLCGLLGLLWSVEDRKNTSEPKNNTKSLW